MMLAAALGASPSAHAQADTPTRTPACTAPEYRQFDFWLGDWEVWERDARAGMNRIEAILDGCALQEQWTGSAGMHGTSLSAYSARDRRWHQTWLDDRGLLLRLEGGLVDGAMVLRGRAPGPDGQPVDHRITWLPSSDGRVRQNWERRRDAGGTWETVFDGTYRRRR